MKTLVSFAALATALACAATPSLATAQDADGDAQPRVIVFGDSLSDGGFFTQILPLAPGEGSFTTNPDPVAPEVFAALLGDELQTAYGEGGLNFAIGGARVEEPSGITIPIATQVENYVASGGTFEDGDIVYIQGGGNDFFAFVRGGGTDPTILSDAATALADTVDRLEELGADRIVTMSIQSNSAAIDFFNTTYKNALVANGANVLFFDTAQLFNEIVANPTQFGITNVTGVACVGSSLSCGPEDYVTPNANRTYLLADSAHPAGITQEIQGQAIASLFTGFTLPGAIARSGQRVIRSQRAQLEGIERNGLNPDGGIGLFGHGSFDLYDETVSGLEQETAGAMLGLTYDVSAATGFGIAAGYADGRGDIEGNGDLSDVDHETWTVHGFARGGVGPFNAMADLTYGEGDIDIIRILPLGPAIRVQGSQTETELLGARASLGLDYAIDSFRVGTEVGVAYERVRVDGFSEDGGFSTSLTVDEVEYESLTGRAGLVASAPITGGAGFFARATYIHEFEDADNVFTVTPNGAPVSYTSSYAYEDRDYAEVALGLSGNLGGVIARAGAAAEVFRTDQQAVTVYGGLALPF